MQQSWNLVNAVHVDCGNHGTLFNISEQRDLAALGSRQGAVSTTQQYVGLNTDGAQLLDRVLGRFGLDLAGYRDVRHQGQVHVQGMLAPQLHTHLANRFQERQRFNIAHRTPDLNHSNISPVGTYFDVANDFIGNVRNNLHRGPEIIATTFLADHALVNLAGSEIIALAHGGAHETLVVTKIEVGFGAILGNKYLAVLEWAHGTGIDIDVRIKFQQGDVEATRFQ